MFTLLLKSTFVGILVGAIFSIIFSIATASSSGKNVITGESMKLKGWKAIYVQINDYGFIHYLHSLFPIFLVISIIATLVVGIILHKSVNSSL